MRHRKLFESATEKVLLVCACFSILSVFFITVFIFQRGAPLFQTVRLRDFLFSTNWQPMADTAPGYGILSFIVGSFCVTGGALLIGVPIGIGCGIFLAEIANGRLATFLRTSVELLAGIPSVVYGFFGVVVVCRLVREVFGGTGYNVLSAAIVLAVMILPTFISITEASIRSVPREYREASFAIGSTHWQTIRRVLVPAGRSGHPRGHRARGRPRGRGDDGRPHGGGECTNHARMAHCPR